MKFTATIDGYTVFAFFHDGKVEFRVDELAGTYTNVPALEKAIKAYDLKLRKDFTNPSAYMMGRWDKEIREVTVTSLDGSDAWVTKGGKREKVRRSDLFVDKASVEAAVMFERKLSEDIKSFWGAVPRWEPRQNEA